MTVPAAVSPVTQHMMPLPNSTMGEAGEQPVESVLNAQDPRCADELTRLREDLAKAREEINVLSHQAGLVEVATGTLHNVANVINSISVSANLVTTRLRGSRVANLARALAMLREHKDGLESFLTCDAKGRMLPAYLETLSEHLSAEHAEVLREMEQVGRLVEHIREIVSMQQNYAQACGAVETLQIADLVQDAIRMQAAALDRHEVTVVREFAEVPAVTVDRHRVLQILINLVRNAKYALDQGAPARKLLVLGISLNGAGRVVVSVRDNGIGITSENLPHIFERGFTTKKEGHGFGLHSSAQAAKQIGGALTVHSDGLGRGATFCLELPVVTNQQAILPDEHGRRYLR
jgi:signal transduction histidine kinase